MKVRKWAAALLLGALFFAFPLGVVRVFAGPVSFWSEVPFFGVETLGWLAAAVCAAFPGRLIQGWRNDRAIRFWLICTGVGMVLLVFQQGDSSAVFGQFSVGLFYLMLPLAGFCCSRELLRMLPYYLGGIGVLAVIAVFRETLSAAGPIVGMTGNWNWSASLLAVTLPFLAFALPIRFRKVAFILLLCVALALPLFHFYPYWSRGTLVAAVGAGVLLAGCRFAARRKRGVRRMMVCLFLLAAFLAGGILLRLPVAGSGSPSMELRAESRIPLWQGAAAMAASRPLTGWGPARFEAEIPRFLPPEYFDTAYATDRHPHPHSEWLVYFCGFGVVGAVLFLTLTVLLLRGVVRCRSREPELLFLGWGALLLLLHGQLDVLLSTPLCGGIFLLTAGAFAAKGGRGFALEPVEPRLPLRALSAAALALLAGGASLRGAVSGGDLREGKLAGLSGRFDAAAGALERSIRWRPGAENLVYLAQLELFNRRNPARAEELLRRLPESGFEVYGHSFRTLGQALAVQGKFPEALDALARDEALFSASALDPGLRAMIFERLGQPALAAEQWRICEERMRRKGLEFRFWPQLLDRPELDDSPVARKRWREEQSHEHR